VRSRGSAVVTSESINLWAAAVTSSTALLKAASLALDGFVVPLSLRTNCNADARISSGVAGGSKLASTLILRHIVSSSVSPVRTKLDADHAFAHMLMCHFGAMKKPRRHRLLGPSRHGMTPRNATLADVAELVRVINLAYQVEATMFHGARTSEADVIERLGRPNAAFVVLHDDASGVAGRRLAGAVFVETRENRGFFAMLSVDPRYQGRGLGRTLVRAAESYCREAGCRVVDIDVVDLRTELPGFYATLGFTRTGATPYPDPAGTKRPVQLIRMEKPLTDPPTREP
jgi:GNAT superfamily N-acetyltransferase